MLDRRQAIRAAYRIASGSCDHVRAFTGRLHISDSAARTGGRALIGNRSVVLLSTFHQKRTFEHDSFAVIRKHNQTHLERSNACWKVVGLGCENDVPVVSV